MHTSDYIGIGCWGVLATLTTAVLVSLGAFLDFWALPGFFWVMFILGALSAVVEVIGGSTSAQPPAAPSPERPPRAAPDGAAWTAAWCELQAVIKNVAEPDLGVELARLVGVAYRERLEDPERFAAQEPAAVVRSVLAALAEYGRIVGQLAAAGGDDPGALEAAQSAAASACLLGVERGFGRPRTEDDDGT